MLHCIALLPLSSSFEFIKILVSKFITVALVMQKPSKSMDIAPILIIFARYGRLIYINLHAKNEQILLSRFPIATVRQPGSD